jgi:asparagine synthase (glutamine-hydrolysing)
MAGIFGIWNFDGRPLERALLERMGRSLAHRGPDGDSLFMSGPAGVGCRLFRVTPESSTEAQPCVRSSGTVVVFDGRLDNRRELIAALRGQHDVSERTPDVELVAACYETAAEGFAARLEGDFAAAVLDLPARRLLLARDAIGVRPLYFWRGGGTLVFASEIKSILTHPGVRAQVNVPVLAEYMVCRLHRQPDDGTTLFEEIQTVPPAHEAVATPEELSVRRYWDFKAEAVAHSIAHPLNDGVSFEALAEEFASLFDRSVRRRLRSASPVAVSVSGGLDSSAIFCAAVRAHRDPQARVPVINGLTYTPADGSPADEHEFVEEIERVAGVSIARVAMARGILDDADDTAWHAETPMADRQWNTTRRLLMAVAASGSRVLLTGHWGDQVLFDQAYLVDLTRAGAWPTVAAHLRAYVTWHPGERAREFRRAFVSDLASHQLSASTYRVVRDLKRAVLRQPRAPSWYDHAFVARAPGRGFGGHEPRTAGAHARSLYREVRSRYNVHCLEWHNKVASMFGVEPAFPFLDRDLLEFLMRTPGEALNRHGVPKAILRKGLQGVVPDRILRRASKGDFTAVVNEGAGPLSGDLARAPGPGSRSVARGFVNLAVLTAALADAQAGLATDSAVAAGHLVDLVGLDLWLNAFFEGENA